MLSKKNWVIVGRSSAKAALNTSSVRKEGGKIRSEFMYYLPEEGLEGFYPSISGKRIDVCEKNKQDKKYQTEIEQAFYHDPKTQKTKKLNKLQIQEMVLRPYQTEMLNRYLCNSLTPPEIKAGMPLIEAKKIMDKKDFKIAKKYYFEHYNFDGEEIGTTCGNGYSGCYVEFIKDTPRKQITIRVNYEGDAVIDAYEETEVGSSTKY